MSQNPSNSVSHTSAPNIQDWTTPGSSANTSNYASQASLNHAGQDFRFSTANTLHDDASTKSKDNELNEGEEDTEEAWEPGTHDEEESPRSAPPQAEKKEGQSDLVEWDGPNDPDNPHNWYVARSVQENTDLHFHPEALPCERIPLSRPGVLLLPSVCCWKAGTCPRCVEISPRPFS